MLKILISSMVVILFQVSFAWGAVDAANTSSSSSPKTDSASNHPGTGLPHCVDDPGEVQSILADEKLNTANSSKYRKFDSALASDSEVELIARLAYSEALAANCSDKTADLLAPISAVIQNRMQAKVSSARKVIFERDQFASSLNNYPESRYPDFLCPHDQALWKKALAAASSAHPDLPASTKSYYLFRHAPRFHVPSWAQKNAVSFRGSESITDCVKFFP